MRESHHYIVEDRGFSSPCWTWQFACDKDGYGKYWRRGRAHRVAYESAHGRIPPEMEIHHLCEQTDCVNPGHLLPVTRAEHARFSRSAQKTHCIHGHEFTEANTYIRPDGRRDCRACVCDRARRYRNQRALAA